MFKKFLRAYTRNRTAGVLRQLSDAQLRDIGVPRHQINDYVNSLVENDQ